MQVLVEGNVVTLQADTDNEQVIVGRLVEILLYEIDVQENYFVTHNAGAGAIDLTLE